MMTRPTVSQWDEQRKNTAWQTVANTRRHSFHMITARRAVSLPHLSSTTWEPVYTDGAFGMGQRWRLPIWLVTNRLDVEIDHFLFVPTLVTSVILSTVAGMRHSRSVQTVLSLYRLGVSPTIASRLFFADRVVALSDWTAGRVRALGITNATRINAGGDLHRFRPPSDPTHLRRRWGLPEDKALTLFCGELTRLGSLGIMLFTAPAVLAASRDLRQLFACPTRSPQDLVPRKKTQQRLRADGLEHSITILGDVSELHTLLAACDMLFYPVSTMTGKFDTPLTVLGAMAKGCQSS